LRIGLPVWDTPSVDDTWLRSPRLTLRPLRPEDAERLVALLGNDRDAVMQMSHMPWPCTLTAAREWIALRTHPGTTAFAIMRVGDEAFLGVIGFGGLHEMPSVGYWIGRPFWNHGYATEALQLVIGQVRTLGAKGLQAETFPENAPSARVLAKCGFLYRGLGRRNYPARGGLVPVCVHILHFATQEAGGMRAP
jgi:RimJ/RimL family protein N-acetyltransferase